MTTSSHNSATGRAAGRRRIQGLIATAAGVAVLACGGTAWATPSSSGPASAPAGAASSGAATSGAASASGGARSQQEVALIAEAATVFIAGEWSGYVQFPTNDGLAWSTKLSADFSCSGFIASSDGNVVTAGHCADPAEGKPMLVDAFLEQQVQAGNITEADAQGFVDDGAETQWAVQGLANGSAPTLAMTVYQTSAASGIPVAAGLTATVIDNRPLLQGDVTLLKVTSPTPMPTLQLAPAEPNVGDTVDAVGYPGSVSQVVDSNLEPTFAQGQVGANQQTTNGAPFTEVSAAMSPGMSGGPVVDDQGRVIGTVSFGPSDETQQLNFAAGWDTIKSLLARNGVDTTPSAADVAYRQGLDLYFAQKYREAAAAFTTVLNTEPSNAYAQEYKSKAVSSEASEPVVAAPAPQGSQQVSAISGSSTPVGVWLIGAAALALVVIAGLMLALRRRGRSVAGVVPGGYLPNGNPMSWPQSQHPGQWQPVSTLAHQYAGPPTAQPPVDSFAGWAPPQGAAHQSWS